MKEFMMLCPFLSPFPKRASTLRKDNYSNAMKSTPLNILEHARASRAQSNCSPKSTNIALQSAAVCPGMPLLLARTLKWLGLELNFQGGWRQGALGDPWRPSRLQSWLQYFCPQQKSFDVKSVENASLNVITCGKLSLLWTFSDSPWWGDELQNAGGKPLVLHLTHNQSSHADVLRAFHRPLQSPELTAQDQRTRTLQKPRIPKTNNHFENYFTWPWSDIGVHWPFFSLVKTGWEKLFPPVPRRPWGDPGKANDHGSRSLTERWIWLQLHGPGLRPAPPCRAAVLQ